jgi:hypothetical protein
MRGISFLLFAVLTSVGACAHGWPTPTVKTRDVHAAVQTDSLAYVLRRSQAMYEARITLAFKNRGARAVEITNCQGQTNAVLERRAGNRWVPVWWPALSQCWSPPIVIAPGATYHAVLPISAGVKGSNIFPQFSDEPLDGVYRLVWGEMSYAGSEREVVDSSEHASNRFSLTVR